MPRNGHAVPRLLAASFVALALIGCGPSPGETSTTPPTAAGQVPTPSTSAAGSPSATDPGTTRPTPSGTPIDASVPGGTAAPICADSATPARLSSPPTANDGTPDPEGRIAFGRITDDDNTLGQRVELYAVDADGSDLVRLLTCQVARPRFSPDGRQLAFGIVLSDRTIRVATMNADGTDLRIVGPGPWAELPDWTPDGRSLVFAYSPIACPEWPACHEQHDFHETLWQMNVDGSDARRIGDPDSYDWEPRVAPDGSAVVFTRIAFPREWFVPMIRDLATGTERQVTSDATEPEHPDWSPDGRSIVYNTLHRAGETASFEQIEQVPADDASTTPDVLYPGADGHGIKPAFSPDGRSIVFGCSRAMCRMDADGSNVRSILTIPGEELNHFDWGPPTPADD